MIIYSFELESYFTCGEIGITNCIRFKLTYKLQLKIFNYKMYSVFWLWFYQVGMDDIASGLTILVACKLLATNVDWFFLLREPLLSVLFWHFKVFWFSGYSRFNVIRISILAQFFKFKNMWAWFDNGVRFHVYITHCLRSKFAY